MPPSRLRRFIIRALSFGVAGVLVYLTLRGSDLNAIGQAFMQAQYVWCVPLAVATIASHVVRAWRWQILVEALPSAKQRPALGTAFGSLMIGFMVNYLLPRVGEFVRAANLARREKLRYSGVLGTIVTERAVDVLTLALGLGLSVLLLSGTQRSGLYATMLQPAAERLAGVPFIWILLAIAVVTLVLWWTLTRVPLGRLARRYLRPLWVSFRDGLATIYRSPRRMALGVSTLLIWCLYALMAYIPLEMFAGTAAHGLTLVDATVIMFVGVLGVVVPTPGGAGSFHYITVLALMTFYGVTQTDAITYAVFVHGAQLILYLAVGLIVILLQGAQFSQVRRYAEGASEE